MSTSVEQMETEKWLWMIGRVSHKVCYDSEVAWSAHITSVDGNKRLEYDRETLINRALQYGRKSDILGMLIIKKCLGMR